jgi:putative transposase
MWYTSSSTTRRMFMDDELKKRLAVFRFGVIADFVGGRVLERGEIERLLREKCARRWQIPGSIRTRVSESALKAWVARYKASGNRLEALYPRERSDRGKSRVIEQDTAMGLIALRKELREVSLPVLMREARQRKIILPDMRVTYSTLYRFLQAEGLVDKPSSIPEDRRKFEAEYPNDLWQSDVMHGPYVTVEGKQKKTYLIAFLDDHSRLMPHAEFYFHERLGCFMDALRKALLIRGIPRKLYVDNGSAFRSHHLEHICASLGIVLLHAKPYQPQGKGKVERFFRTAREQFLSVLNLTTLDKLNDALKTWLSGYHATIHRGTGQTPLKRFAQNIECVRPAPKDLEDHFRNVAKRTVAKDRTIALNGRLYEAPVPLIGKQVTLLYHEHDPARVEIVLAGKTYGFVSMVDVNVNCRIRRGKDALEIETPNNLQRYRGGRLFGLRDEEDNNE